MVAGIKYGVGSIVESPAAAQEQLTLGLGATPDGRQKFGLELISEIAKSLAHLEMPA